MNATFPYRAMILDLDGVITDTRKLHLESWRETFRDFAFTDEDYDRYVNGMPREEGIRTFLSARKISASPEVLEKYSSMKNKLYLNRLRKLGTKAYKDSVETIRKWKQQGIPVAVVSSSRNCTEVLEAAGIRELFDVQIDPAVADPIHLRPKPEADYFLEAARRLGKKPEECALVEDSIVGIQAGLKGHFKAVIGITRGGQTTEDKLLEQGAGQVVHSLEMIGKKENALRAWDEIKKRIGDREVALFLDFDGTLSDIVSDPTTARPRDSIVPLLKCCSKSLKVAIISGRDRMDLKHRIDEDNIFYAGCHGFTISGPGGFHYEVERANEVLPELNLAGELVNALIKDFEGSMVETKKYFIAVHYRRVNPEKIPEIKERVRAIASRFSKLELREGKMVIELSPHLEWGKGHAIGKLCDVLEIKSQLNVPIYLGDDLTDEDAFRRLKGGGISIKVGPEKIYDSIADYWLKDPSEVEEFLKVICRDFTGKEKKWRHGP